MPDERQSSPRDAAEGPEAEAVDLQADTPRRPWIEPAVRELPHLTDLTLVTGDPIGGGFSGGSTVF